MDNNPGNTSFVAAPETYSDTEKREKLEKAIKKLSGQDVWLQSLLAGE